MNIVQKRQALTAALIVTDNMLKGTVNPESFQPQQDILVCLGRVAKVGPDLTVFAKVYRTLEEEVPGYMQIISDCLCKCMVPDGVESWWIEDLYKFCKAEE